MIVARQSSNRGHSRRRAALWKGLFGQKERAMFNDPYENILLFGALWQGRNDRNASEQKIDNIEARRMAAAPLMKLIAEPSTTEEVIEIADVGDIRRAA
jgi:hypothetical protein